MLIIVSTAAISFSNTDKRKLLVACAQIQSEIRYAQKLAIAEGVATGVFFDLGRQFYRLRKEEFSFEDVMGFPQKPSSTWKVLNTTYLEKGIEIDYINNKTSSVDYTFKGTTSSACTISIKSKKYLAKITITVGTGRAKITEIDKINR